MTQESNCKYREYVSVFTSLNYAFFNFLAGFYENWR